MDLSIFKSIFNRHPDSHKYDYGHVLVIGGSPGMVGAPFLAARSALRIGAGLVTVASAPAVIDKLEKRVEEIMTFRLGNQPEELVRFTGERKISAVAIGPGNTPGQSEVLLDSIKSLDLPMVIDGGALSDLAGTPELITPGMILTPHEGEFRRFYSDPLPKDRDSLAKLAADFAKSNKVVLVLKGHPTLVFSAEGKTYENSSGGPELATAGTGDVLTGMIAGLISQKLEPLAAARAAVYLHGLAGGIAVKAKTVPGVIASDVIEAIPLALKVVQNREV